MTAKTQETFLQRLESSGIGKALLAERKQEIAVERARFVAQRAKLVKDHDAWAIPALKVEATVRVKVIDAMAVVKDFQLQLGRLRAERSGRSGRLNAEMLRLEREIQQLEAPEIDALAMELRIEQTRLQYGPLRGDEVGGYISGGNPDVKNPKFDPVAKDTHPAAMATRRERGERVDAAIKAADALRLEALSEEDLKARIDVIRQSVNGAAGGKASK